MSNFKPLIVLALFGIALVALSLPASAQVAPLLCGAPPIGGVGLPVPYGNFGNGITESDTWSNGIGNAATTNSFVNDFTGQLAAQGFGGPFGGLCGPCGVGPTAFSSFGPFQTGVGGDWGAQNSAANGGSHAMTFGLQPLGGVVFGIPVPGPGGLVFT